MITQQDEWVILGLTLDGETFAAPDWARRLCNSLARTGADGRKTYSSYVRPVISDGVQCVVVCASLQGADAQAYDMLKRYVAENHLKVRSGRNSMGAEAAGPLPVMGKERRDPHRNIW
ncbi:MAG: DUF3579 domain-containing protein [Gallionella sp.]